MKILSEIKTFVKNENFVKNGNIVKNENFCQKHFVNA